MPVSNGHVVAIMTTAYCSDLKLLVAKTMAQSVLRCGHKRCGSPVAYLWLFFSSNYISSVTSCHMFVFS